MNNQRVCETACSDNFSKLHSSHGSMFYLLSHSRCACRYSLKCFIEVAHMPGRVARNRVRSCCIMRSSVKAVCAFSRCILARGSGPSSLVITVTLIKWRNFARNFRRVPATRVKRTDDDAVVELLLLLSARARARVFILFYFLFFFLVFKARHNRIDYFFRKFSHPRIGDVRA